MMEKKHVCIQIAVNKVQQHTFNIKKKFIYKEIKTEKRQHRKITPISRYRAFTVDRQTFCSADQSNFLTKISKQK